MFDKVLDIVTKVVVIGAVIAALIFVLWHLWK
jgi:hypothetical protein